MRIYFSTLFCLILQASIFSQSTEINVTESNGIGVNIENPTSYLHIEVPASFTSDGIYCNMNLGGSPDKRAIRGVSTEELGFGVGGHFSGGYQGVFALGDGGAYTHPQYPVYGLFSEARGTAGKRTGVFARALGGETNIGIHAEASGGEENLAAKFGDGDVEIENLVRINSEESLARLTISNTDNIGNEATAIRVDARNNGSETTYGNYIYAENTGTGNSIGVYVDTWKVGDFAFYGRGNGYFSGDVRIGQNVDPDELYKLIVDGRILGEEVRVQNSLDWPDYVFNEDYDLWSLPQIEEYIEINNHLPNIPPASEIEKEGIALGEMQIKLMEKVEELTLHLIAQQKEIEVLKQQLNLLNNEK